MFGTLSLMNTAFALLTSDEFVPQTLVLIDSIRQFHPESTVHVLYMGSGKRLTQIEERAEHTWYPEDIKPGWVSPYDNFADTIAAYRPAFLTKVLQSVEVVVLLGSDCVLYEPIDDFFQSVGSVLFTPHFLEPFDDSDGKHPNYQDLRNTGLMNVDVVGLSKNDETFAFLHWLDQTLETWKLSAFVPPLG